LIVGMKKKQDASNWKIAREGRDRTLGRKVGLKKKENDRKKVSCRKRRSSEGRGSPLD